jgi:hypothetical protein
MWSSPTKKHIHSNDKSFSFNNDKTLTESLFKKAREKTNTRVSAQSVFRIESRIGVFLNSIFIP